MSRTHTSFPSDICSRPLAKVVGWYGWSSSLRFRNRLKVQLYVNVLWTGAPRESRKTA